MLALLAFFQLLPILAFAAHNPPHRRAHERARKNYEHIHGRNAEETPSIVERDNHYDNRTIVERDHFDNRTLTPRGTTYTGVGTFYYTGLGACGLNSQDGDYMVALNSAQYGSGYPGPQCFKHITIQMGSTTIGGVEILDECPTCDYGSLDLSPGLFTQFAGYDAGTIHITWWFDDDAPAETSTSETPTSTYVPPTSTWVAPSPSSTSTYVWVPPSSSTSEWVEPSTSPTPSSTTQWYTPPAETSTSTTPTSTWVAPSSSSTSDWVESSAYSSSAPSSTITSSAYSSASAAVNSTNPFAIVSDVSNSSVSATISSNAGVSGGSSQASVEVTGNLEMINALAAQYGQLVVEAALQG
ncbi:B2-aldehyde-forming enzyme [Cryptococcus neoformans var. grubii Br795]|nr:B2-aldehyde-forming enzyme [Cryptococcus neoformans var. grubii AD1-83a]OXG30423.1 B2-aldehyde-forming enzyme [Cryptococcus neoformans var. grubii Bt15]OXG32997.1 B2-aldehyde-forming enzyme [Cryptococcus neoformans var. grubii Bt120]OXG41242.1 B2-aldehyde-forming enzyme [Cryptococcus neoformans var. grubii Th84]OXG43756.1 B2-aldehyde-forming enzyme [Cryptococcus neoformans var. grubii MW-RSA1955]OXG47840.1 B2-aldehyde-forming enzyme [Cryptococcus neoformans var. grubii CHC193]OXG56471.1 B2